MDKREQSHLVPLHHLVSRDWSAAALALDFRSVGDPRDLLALQTGHLMDLCCCAGQKPHGPTVETLDTWRERRLARRPASIRRRGCAVVEPVDLWDG